MRETGEIPATNVRRSLHAAHLQFLHATLPPPSLPASLQSKIGVGQNDAMIAVSAKKALHNFIQCIHAWLATRLINISSLRLEQYMMYMRLFQNLGVQHANLLSLLY